jgi:hypothetical protein
MFIKGTASEIIEKLQLNNKALDRIVFFSKDPNNSDWEKLKLVLVEKNLLNSIKSLTIEGIHHLYPGMFKGMMIDTLGIKDSYIKRITEGVFIDLKDTLKSLSIYNNPIKEISKDAFVGLCLLKTLNLKASEVEFLCGGHFRDLINLKNLQIINNKISILPEKIFNNLKEVTQINFSENRIESIPDRAFIGLSKLKALKLNENAIHEFSITKSSIDSLQPLLYLDVSKNCLNVDNVDEIRFYVNLFSEVKYKENFKLLVDGTVSGFDIKIKEKLSTEIVFEHLKRARWTYAPVIFQMALEDHHEWCDSFSVEEKVFIKAWKKEVIEKFSREACDLLICLRKKELDCSEIFERKVLPMIFSQYGGYPATEKLSLTVDEAPMVAEKNQQSLYF